MAGGFPPIKLGESNVEVIEKIKHFSWSQAKSAAVEAINKARYLAPVAVVAVAAPAHAAIDLTSITGSFSASDITTAVLAVAGVLATIYATMTAAKMALRWIRGG